MTATQVQTQGLPTTAVIASAADHAQVETNLARLQATARIPPPETYVTTQVTPVAINDMPIDQWLKVVDPAGKMQPANLQHRLGKFGAIQGFDLAHGQTPDGDQISFSTRNGSGVEHNLGRDGQTVAPSGRLLTSADADSRNVLIPIEANWTASDQVCCVDFYVGDTITVQSQDGAQTETLHVVGIYEDDGASTSLFGGILADASVAQTLSGGMRISPHTLRHSFAKQWLANGGELIKLSRVMGHTDIETTQVYLKDFTARDARGEHTRFSPVSTHHLGRHGKGASRRPNA